MEPEHETQYFHEPSKGVRQLKKILLFALLIGSSAYAQNNPDPCAVAPGANAPDGCFPLTYKPADGSAERPVFLSFKPGPEPTPVAFKGGGALPGASRKAELDFGVNASYNSTDYGSGGGNILVGGFVTFTAKRFGVEANGSYTADSRNTIHENTLMVGPRYNLLDNRLLVGYIKASFGGGHFSGVQSYGGGIDLHAAKHLNVRLIDAEYQHWSFPPDNLSPYTITSGISFRL
jgi:hypothetical protein